jgi:hypothetical protein
VKFVVFYLLCGLAATFAQLAFSAGSGVPNLGASGAIAGVLGALRRACDSVERPGGRCGGVSLTDLQDAALRWKKSRARAHPRICSGTSSRAFASGNDLNKPLPQRRQRKNGGIHVFQKQFVCSTIFPLCPLW